MASIFIYSLGSKVDNPVNEILQVLTTGSTWKIIKFSVWQAGLSTLFTLFIGLPGAYLFARYDFKGKSLLKAITTIPFVMPPLVVAAAFSALLGPRGWVNQGLMDIFRLENPPIHFMNSLWAIITAHIFFNTTIILRTVGDFWSHLDMKLGQAASMLGANRFQVMMKITLPLISPAVTAASLLVFIFDFTSFGVILFLGGPQFTTLEVEIYNQAINYLNITHAAILAVIQLVFIFIITLIYQKMSSRIEMPLAYRVKTNSQRFISNWRTRIWAISFISILFVFLLTPMIALAVKSVTTIDLQTNTNDNKKFPFSLQYYQELNQNRRRSFFYAPPSTAISLSLAYASITVVISLLLGIPAALVLTRNPEFSLSRLIDGLLFLPLGTSSVTLGLGFILALGHPPLNLRTSPLLIPIAHSLVALPFVIRNLVPALRSIQPKLHFAASILGASPIQIVRWIDFPLISRAILTAATFAFTISIGEFGATAMIARPEYPTIPIAIYRFLGQPGAINYGQALAMSTILMVICGSGMLFIEKMRIPGQNGI